MDRGQQFPEIKDSLIDGGNGIPEVRKLSKGSAYIEYEHDPDVKQTNISYFKSSDEGKGHAQELMHHLYGKYPDHTINWGQVISKPAVHLLDKFSGLYGRTKGHPDLDEDYARELGKD
jgi:hypothetical protein